MFHKFWRNDFTLKIIWFAKKTCVKFFENEIPFFFYSSPGGPPRKFNHKSGIYPYYHCALFMITPKILTRNSGGHKSWYSYDRVSRKYLPRNITYDYTSRASIVRWQRTLTNRRYRDLPRKPRILSRVIHYCSVACSLLSALYTYTSHVHVLYKCLPWKCSLIFSV